MQTSYPNAPNANRPGDLVDNSPATTCTRVSSAAIPFGRFVTKDQSAGAGDSAVKLPAASADVTNVALIQGVALRQHTVPNQPDVTPDSYRVKDAIAVATKARVVVYSEQAVTVVDPVYIRYTDNGAGKYAGQVRKDADTGKAALLASGRFLYSISGPGPVGVEYAIP